MNFDFVKLLSDPAILVAVAIVLLVAIVSGMNKKESIKPVVNVAIKKTEAKVVDVIDCGEIENLAQFKDGKLVMCRCWRSEKFPYCDGSHVKHNTETGDNVGPLIIKK